jgi:hypothetical protein
MEKYNFYKRTGLKGGAEQVVSNQGASNQDASNEVISNEVISNEVVPKASIEFKYLLNSEEKENKTPKINLDNVKLMDFFRQATL